MAAYGQKRPVRLLISMTFERPLLGKADIQGLATLKSLRNGRFTPGTGRSGNIAVNDRL
jgi:hypothetical protein